MSEAEWETCRGELALPSDRGIVFIVEAEEAETYCAALAERISWKHHCVYDAMLNRVLFLVSGEFSRESLAELVKEALAETMPGSREYFFGMGEPRRGTELYLSSGEALRDLESQRKQSCGETQDRERQRIIQLRRKTGVADPGETRKLFSLLWAGIFAANEFSIAKAKMVSVFTFLLDDIYGAYGGRSSGGNEEAPPFNAAREIMALKDLAAWESWAAAAFEKLLKEAALRRSGNFPLPLVKAIAYIQSCYADPSLQLNSAAEAAQVSPAYLSRLFSDHLSSSFVDYLTEFRIEKSEQLIRESGLSIKEIAFAVGYQDPNYFSKIFRKTRGQSPSEFAEQNRQ
jgi:two-component system response regulator YesN